MLEVFVTCLHHYATLLKDKQAAQDQGLGDYLYFYKHISTHFLITHFNILFMRIIVKSILIL